MIAYFADGPWNGREMAVSNHTRMIRVPVPPDFTAMVSDDPPSDIVVNTVEYFLTEVFRHEGEEYGWYESSRPEPRAHRNVVEADLRENYRRMIAAYRDIRLERPDFRTTVTGLFDSDEPARPIADAPLPYTIRYD